MAGTPRLGEPSKYLGGFAAGIRLLNAAGVDAVALTPEWFAEGVEMARQYVDASGFAVLCANIADTCGIPIGHPSVVKQCGALRIGLTAVWSAGDDPRLQQRNLKFCSPVEAARRTLPALRGRAVVTAILVNPAVAGAANGYSLAVGDSVNLSAIAGVPGLDTMVLVDWGLDNVDSILGRERLTLTDARRHPKVGAVIDSLKHFVDSASSAVVALMPSALTPAELSHRLANRVLEVSGADCFVFGPVFISSHIETGPLTMGRILEILADPGPCVLFETTVRDLCELLRDPAITSVVRPGRSLRTSTTADTLKVAATSHFLGQHSHLALGCVEYLPIQLWQTAVELFIHGKE
ncbi:MAG: hypothetical protein ABIK37_03195 [candidate division WOR-3 bacterium]